MGNVYPTLSHECNPSKGNTIQCHLTCMYAECGDGVCASEVGETCETCSVDCCPQQQSTINTQGIIVGIFVPLVLLSLSTVAIVAVSEIIYLQ